MMISACIIAIGAGLVCLFDSEFAWQLYERDSQTIGLTVSRTRDWKHMVMAMGVFLIVLGVVGIFASFSQ